MFGREVTDTDIRNYRMVWVWFGNKSKFKLLFHRQDTYIIHKDHVDRFIQATRELHDNPGINPHTNSPTTPVHQIEVAPFLATGPYWWSTPGLQKNDDPNGAVIIGGEFKKVVVWQSDALKKLLEEEAKHKD